MKRTFQWNFSSDTSELFGFGFFSGRYKPRLRSLIKWVNSLLEPKFTEQHKLNPTTSQPKSKNERVPKIESNGKRRWGKSNSLDKLLQVLIKVLKYINLSLFYLKGFLRDWISESAGSACKVTQQKTAAQWRLRKDAAKLNCFSHFLFKTCLVHFPCYQKQSLSGVILAGRACTCLYINWVS